MGQADFEFGHNDPNYRTDDPPSYAQACMGLLVCPHCGLSVICGDIHVAPEHQFHQPEDNTNMDLKTHRSKNTGTGKYVQRPFLKPKDIPAKTGLPFTVIEMREAPKNMEYSDFLMDIKTAKKEYVVGLRSESVLLDQLIDSFGTKSESWGNKKGTLVIAKGKYINLK